MLHGFAGRLRAYEALQAAPFTPTGPSGPSWLDSIYSSLVGGASGAVNFAQGVANDADGLTTLHLLSKGANGVLGTPVVPLPANVSFCKASTVGDKASCAEPSLGVNAVATIGSAGIGAVGAARGAVGIYRAYKAVRAARAALTAVTDGTDVVAAAGNLTDAAGPAASDPLAIEAPTRSNPYAEGTELSSGAARPGERFNMVFSQGQVRHGGFGTFEDVPDQAFARGKLAITHEFKPDVSYVQQFEIPDGPPIQIQEGTVGPQPGDGVTYPGGASQLEILNFGDRARLIPVGQPMPLMDLETDF